MSTINSEIGWSCDSDYFVEDAAAVLITVGEFNYTKNNDGAAIVAIFNAPDGFSGPIIMSTIAENTYYTATYNNNDILSSCVINGTTWYIATANGWHQTYYGVSSSFPTITEPTYEEYPYENRWERFMRKLYDEASVQYSIATTNYVKSFVEGVTTENNKRIATPSVIGASLFSASSSYSVNDYVIKDGNLYKCTTAHTGNWNPSNFTQTSIMAEVERILNG